MKGSFPPFTPTQSLESTYNDVPISAHCYFGYVLSSKKGGFGIVASIIQSKKGVSSDKCEISIKSKQVEILYF
jgi:hypothetical protein